MGKMLNFLKRAPAPCSETLSSLLLVKAAVRQLLESQPPFSTLALRDLPDDLPAYMLGRIQLLCFANVLATFVSVIHLRVGRQQARAVQSILEMEVGKKLRNPRF